MNIDPNHPAVVWFRLPIRNLIRQIGQFRAHIRNWWMAPTNVEKVAADIDLYRRGALIMGLNPQEVVRKYMPNKLSGFESSLREVQN